MQSGTGQLVHLHLHIQLGEVNRERVGRPWAQDETSNFLVACLEEVKDQIITVVNDENSEGEVGRCSRLTL